MMRGAGLYIRDSQNSIDMWNYYLGKNRDSISPYASPSRATNIADLPSAFTMTAEHDPLRDEAILYAMQLMNTGVQIEVHNYPGTVHRFDSISSEISSGSSDESVRVFKRAVN